jgi:hypothetical protein
MKYNQLYVCHNYFEQSSIFIEKYRFRIILIELDQFIYRLSSKNLKSEYFKRELGGEKIKSSIYSFNTKIQ